MSLRKTGNGRDVRERHPMGARCSIIWWLWFVEEVSFKPRVKQRSDRQWERGKWRRMW